MERKMRSVLVASMAAAALAVAGCGDDGNDKAATGPGPAEAEAATVQPSTPSNSTSGTSDAAQQEAAHSDRTAFEDASAQRAAGEAQQNNQMDKTLYFNGGSSDAAQP